jgi:hypothetical protein
MWKRFEHSSFCSIGVEGIFSFDHVNSSHNLNQQGYSCFQFWLTKDGSILKYSNSFDFLVACFF